jgi:hypothetical protein
MFVVNSRFLRVVVLPLAVAIGVFVLPAAASAAAKPGDNEIEARWTALGGESGPLGAKLPPPGNTPYDVPGGRAQDFANGSIFWSADTGAWDVRGAVLDRYVAAEGPAGTLAFPTAAAGPAGVPDAEVQPFTGGRIYSSAATGAHALQGAVLAKYLSAGGPTGALQLPTEDETAVTGGTRTVFQGGHIYRSAAGSFVVRGPILTTYLAAGASTGALGMPTSDQLPRALPGSLVSVFAGGRIYWSAATGARAVYGAILTKYLQIGAERSYLGLPTTSEYAVTGGRRSRFTGGYITKLTGQAAVVTGYWLPSVRRVTASEMPYTYRPGCPVGPTGLRRVKMPYYDWAGVPRLGDIVLRTSATDDMQRVFYKAFRAKFPIRKMRLVDVYKGSDITSMAADNTSAFNCRKVTGNPYRLSQHSYGHAIDINTVENPYVTASRVYPAGSETYLNRRNVRKGMIVSSGVLAKAMRTEGWPWGARWSHPDYQHFSANGG